MPREPRKKIGEVLIEAGLIDEFQLRSALADQKRWGNRLGVTLVKLGFVEEQALMKHLSRLMGLPVADIEGKDIDIEVLALVPPDLAEKLRCVPLFVDEDGSARFLYVAMDEPADVPTIDALSFRTGMEVCPALVGHRQLDRALRRFYGVGQSGEMSLGPQTADSFEIGGSGELVGPECLFHDEPEEPRLAQEPDPPISDDKPHDLSTRRILQALTHLLIDKGVITREELMAEVQRLASRGDDST